VAASLSRHRDRNLALVVTFWQTALRVSELARLRTSQVDREARLLRDVLIKGGHVVDVTLNDETLAVLDRYLASRGELDADAPLFARSDGGRLSVRAIQALFERWKLELGWTRALHPHVLRHTHATGALALGVDIAVVADLLRHKGLRQVMTYAAVQDAGRREALRKLGRLVPSSFLAGAAPVNDGVATPGQPATSTQAPRAQSTCAEGPFDAAA
jgi:site-specific recombinase XerD